MLRFNTTHRLKKHFPWPRNYIIILSAALSLAVFLLIGITISQQHASADVAYNNGFEIDTSGWAGKHAGYINHAGTFFDIDTKCGASPSATLVGEVRECYVSEGEDLIVWTLHFSTFVAYNTIGVPNTGIIKG